MVEFTAPMGTMAVAHKRWPLANVVWDEEQSDEEMADLMQCKQVAFTSPVISKSDANNGVFDELLSKVVWDDELVQGVQSHDTLLKSLAHGEFPVDVDSKPITDLVTSEALVSTRFSGVV